MSGPQPNALAAITAALAAKQPGAVVGTVQNNAPPPAQQQLPFAFVPQPSVTPANLTGVPTFPAPAHLPTGGFIPVNPFQPSPVQAQAAFVAAVPRAAEQHVHPSTGVPFAPINPPGEAASAPTVGLDATKTLEHFGPAPVQSVQVAVNTETLVADDVLAPKPRTRRAKKDAEALPSVTPAYPPPSAGDGAAESAAESAAPSVEYAPSVMREFSTEEMRNELKRRGWVVTLA